MDVDTITRPDEYMEESCLSCRREDPKVVDDSGEHFWYYLEANSLEINPVHGPLYEQEVAMFCSRYCLLQYMGVFDETCGDCGNYWEPVE